MAIVLICPSCKTRLTLGDDRAGKAFDCPRCHTVIGVPVVLPSSEPSVKEEKSSEPEPTPDRADEPDPDYRLRRRKKGVNKVALIGVSLLGLVALILVVGAVVRSKRVAEHNAKRTTNQPSSDTRTAPRSERSEATREVDSTASSGTDTAADAARLVMGLALVVFSLGFYFAPSIIAVARGHNNIAPIFVVNFFLGWLLVGWVISLAWAFTDLKHLENKKRSYL